MAVDFFKALVNENGVVLNAAKFNDSKLSLVKQNDTDDVIDISESVYEEMRTTKLRHWTKIWNGSEFVEPV